MELPGGVHIYRHGDDFIVVGPRAAVKAFGQDLGMELLLKERGTLGPKPECGAVAEISVLNRLVRWCPGGEEALEYPGPGMWSSSWRSWA